MGCTMYFVATKTFPFEAANPLGTIPKIVEGKYAPIGRKDVSQKVKDLIYSMMNKVCL
jgi:hypothetical protein